MNKTRDNLLSQVKMTAKNLEEAEEVVEEVEALDVKFIGSLIEGELQPSNIILTVTTGGPSIELDLASYAIYGHWSGEEVDYPIFEEDLRQKFNRLWNHYSTFWQAGETTL